MRNQGERGFRQNSEASKEHYPEINEIIYKYVYVNFFPGKNRRIGKRKNGKSLST